MPELDLDRVREIRARHPEALVHAAAARRRRSLLDESGRMLIVAADHPARNAFGVRSEAMAMASREELLTRLVTALSRPGVDGVLGTPDIIEDLLLLGALDDKLVFGSMNRAGLQGAVFELDDRFTGYDAEAIEQMGYDGGKMLTRVALDDAHTAATLEACAHAVSDLARRKLVAMVEPFLSSWVDGRVRNDLSAEGCIRSLGVCSGLGVTSAYTWLKLPVVEEMDRVMAATTLPTLLLGGDPSAAPDETFATWEKALSLPGVRGLVVGRSLLYPPDGDVQAAVDTAASLVRPAPVGEIVR
jgi:DhnA family fructose-bisphosphate aldolase class Ia